MAAITMTYEIVGTDAAEGRMRKAGRTAWDEDDYELAVATEYRLWWRAQDYELLLRRCALDVALTPYTAVITDRSQITREHLEWALFAETNELILWACAQGPQLGVQQYEN